MPTKAELKTAEVLANRREAFEKKVRALLGHVYGRVKKSELDAAFATVKYGEYGPVADALAAEIAAREPVGHAIHARKYAAVQFAEQKAREVVKSVEKELAEHGGDRNAFAAYPMRMAYGDPRYDAAKRKYSLVHALTKEDPAKGYQISSMRNEPNYAVMDPQGIERFVEHAMQDAAIQYDAFICKMVSKIGPCDSAKLEGDHVWSFSHLHVAKGEAVEVWRTQQIVNYSKYGRPYLQWPSRLLKGGSDGIGC